MKNLNLNNYAKPNIKENSIFTQTKQSSETTLNIFNEIRNSCVSQEPIENQVRNKNISVHPQIGSIKFCQNFPTSEKIKQSNQIYGESQTHFFDKYTLGKTLYQKENCQVVVCYENNSNIPRVAKILKCSSNIDEDLTSEIQINYQLFNFPHKNIISLIGIFRDHDQTILVFEYLQGGTLYEFLKKKNFRLTNQETKLIMKQILKGLRYLHNLNILHRDIKLDNIMFAEENNIKSLKIIDFGCATFSDNNKSKQIKCGTPGYAAPEIYQSKYYDFTCDIYSLGGIFHILLTGTRIFPSNISSNQLQALNSQNNYTLNGSITCPKIIKFLQSMLNFQPNRPSAQQCLQNDFFKKETKNFDQPSKLSQKMADLEFPTFKNPFLKK